MRPVGCRWSAIDRRWAGGWPPIALPIFDPDTIGSLVAPAAALALLGTLELAVTARQGGARPSMRREIAGQGLANIAGAFHRRLSRLGQPHPIGFGGDGPVAARDWPSVCRP